MEGRYHILHIDDDIYIRKILSITLASEFELSSCTNGIEALAWLEKGNLPDLIITDLYMPELSGNQLIELLRQRSAFRNVSIIVLSGLEDRAMSAQCLAQGADAFIVKPFNPFDVKATIKSILKEKNERPNYAPAELNQVY